MWETYEHDFLGEDWGRGGFVDVGGVFVAVGACVGWFGGMSEGTEGAEASDGAGDGCRCLGLVVGQLDLKAWSVSCWSAWSGWGSSKSSG